MNKFKFITLAVSLMLAISFTLSCSSGGSSDGGGSDGDGKENGKDNNGSSTGDSNLTACVDADVKIGNQTWKKCNLSVVPKAGSNNAATNSWCYGGGGYRAYTILEEEDYKDEVYITLSSEQVEKNCKKYGRLYDWATAMALPEKCNSRSASEETNAYDKYLDEDCAIDFNHQGICPDGFHIPTNEDWDELLKYIDEENDGEGDDYFGIYTSNTAAKYLIAQGGWEVCGYTDTEDLECFDIFDTYGFSALPGGKLTKGESKDYKFYYYGVDESGSWWTASEDVFYQAYLREIELGYYGFCKAYGDSEGNYSSSCDSGIDEEFSWDISYKTEGLSVRCVKD